MSSMLIGKCKNCTLTNCNECGQALEREQELISRERAANKITDRISEMRSELVQLYDNETEFLSDKSIHSIHEVIKALYQTESIVKEHR